MSDPDTFALTPPRPCYLTLALKRLGPWTYLSGVLNCQPSILCITLNHFLFPSDGGPQR